MRKHIYNFLVNKHAGITYRYHKVHDGTAGARKLFSWFYLLWLNFAYYCLFMKFIGRAPQIQIYESKRIPVNDSESRLYRKEVSGEIELSVDAYVEKLSGYDIISFDIFDTLIFRPFSIPVDLFRVVGEQLGILDFTNIRTWAEWDARMKCNEKNGHMEVTLADIYRNLEEDVGALAAHGQEVEIDAELSLCYANPFMLEVWRRLSDSGRRIIVVSDMYLSKDVLTKILEKNGFTGFEKLYVSCEYGKNKASGTLYKKVLADLGFEKLPKHKMIHVGDNAHSDRDMAKANGIDTLLYPRIDKNAILYRPYDMSFMVGSAYRGLVTNHLYNGLEQFGMEYEYGYVYGGLFVTGYCSFIHDYCKLHDIDKLLFLARDGDILKQVYEMLYPEDICKTEYVLWSRKAATTLMANEDKHDYFRRFLYHKQNQGYTIKEILSSMGLESLTGSLKEWKSIWRKRTYSAKAKFIDLKPDDELTDKNGYLLRRFIEGKWDKVLRLYKTNQEGAKRYYKEILQGASSAVAIDIGWAGSGAMALSHLVEKVWDIPCKITGLIAGTNTVYNLEPDASEPFLQNGRLVAYLYSQNHNRDLLKKHDLNKDYNIFWELLLSSPTPQFYGFYQGKQKPRKPDGQIKNDCKYGKDIYREDLDITLRFGKYDYNLDGIRQVQKGILDFAMQYHEHFAGYPYMFHISGRDAYAPMLVAASHNEKYLKAIKKLFDLEVNVN